MCRLALSDEDREVRDWFCAELKTLGCQVKVDEMGNMFGIRPGRKEGKPTAMGSHLDTQPTGELKSLMVYAGLMTVRWSVRRYSWSHGRRRGLARPEGQQR